MVALVLLLGCEAPRDGAELGMVSGTVTLDGNPLAGAEVMFFPDNARRSQGTTDESGRYTLFHRREVPGAVVGRHTVVISKIVDSPHTGPIELLPERYSGMSQMRRQVQLGENVLDFELRSEDESESAALTESE